MSQLLFIFFLEELFKKQIDLLYINKVKIMEMKRNSLAEKWFKFECNFEFIMSSLCFYGEIRESKRVLMSLWSLKEFLWNFYLHLIFELLESLVLFISFPFSKLPGGRGALRYKPGLNNYAKTWFSEETL